RGERGEREGERERGREGERERGREGERERGRDHVQDMDQSHYIVLKTTAFLGSCAFTIP
ncbi:hypothetical protein, partial [Bosea sp. (in: a-proteobacteria)]|uniref:hypothetical protein n=1 Tax=Bosea sp. (in: a-proteobacteria) TaxID=1871050 RepID=UPI0031FEE749